MGEKIMDCEINAWGGGGEIYIIYLPQGAPGRKGLLEVVTNFQIYHVFFFCFFFVFFGDQEGQWGEHVL